MSEELMKPKNGWVQVPESVIRNLERERKALEERVKELEARMRSLNYIKEEIASVLGCCCCNCR